MTLKARLLEFWQTPSILKRILVLHAVAIAVTAIILPVFASGLLSEIDEYYQRKRLNDRYQVISLSLHEGRRSFIRDRVVNIDPIIQENLFRGGGFYCVVLDKDRKILSTTGPIVSEYKEKLPRKKTHFRVRDADGPTAGLIWPYQSNHEIYYIEIGQDLAHPDVVVDDIENEFLISILWVTLPILALLIVVDVVIVREALRPLVRSSRDAGQIVPSRMSVRLWMDGLPAEVKPLVGAVNLALGRLERGFRLQAEFAADVAHELRTPLALLRLRLEAMPQNEETVALLRDIESMGRTISQMLSLVELESEASLSRQVTDLHEIAVSVIETYAPMAVRKGQELALIGKEETVFAFVNGDMIFMALRNLVENALNYSPPGTLVEVLVEAPARLVVMDRGPGVPSDLKTLVFHRGWRRQTANTKGAGLGLSIVARIVQLCGGEIHIEDRPGGGAVFILNLNPGPNRS